MGVTTLREGMPLDKTISLKTYKKIGEDGLSGGVAEVCFYPTYKCNLNCYMCHVQTTRNFDEPSLSLERLKKAFSAVDNIKTMFYLGGEPFIKKGMMDIIKFFDTKGMSHIISTNGMIMTKEMAEDLARLKNPVNMQVSLNGSGKNDSTIRGVPNTLEKTVETIKTLKKAGLQVWVHCVPVKENMDDLGNVVRLSSELNVDEVHFIFAQVMTKEDEIGTKERLKEWLGCEVAVGGYVGEIDYSEEQMINGVMAAKEESRKNNLPIRFFPKICGEKPELYWRGTILEHERPVCQIHLMHPMTPVIGPEGNVYACTNINKSFGNITNESLEEIWDSAPLRELRKGMIKDKLMPLCRRCPCVDILEED